MGFCSSPNEMARIDVYHYHTVTNMGITEQIYLYQKLFLAAQTDWSIIALWYDPQYRTISRIARCLPVFCSADIDGARVAIAPRQMLLFGRAWWSRGLSSPEFTSASSTDK